MTVDDTMWEIVSKYEQSVCYQPLGTFLNNPLCEFCKAPSSHILVRKSKMTDKVYRHYTCSRC